jgi:aminomethyltransferase
MTDLRVTPLAAWHEQNGGRMVDFAGYRMPVQYEGVMAEHLRVRESVGLFDISHMAELHVRGTGSREFVDSLVTNQVGRLEIGQILYTALCREDGGVLDDLLIYCLAEEHFLVVANASNREKVADWMAERVPPGLDFEDRSDQTALIAIQGPHSLALLENWPAAAGILEQLRPLPYYRTLQPELDGVACILSRTGYTGERGYELYLPAEHAERVWTELMIAGASLGVAPIGLGARDTLRLEACYSLYGHELDEEHTPFESNIGWVVRLKKPVEFVGKAALAAQKAEGSPHAIIGFVVEGRAIARQGASLHSGDRELGVVTSGTFSPTLQRGVALARVASDAVDLPLEVEIRGKRLPATRVEIPFVAPRVKD